MLDYYEKYRKRMYPGGNTVARSREVSTKNYVNYKFQDTPFYDEVIIIKDFKDESAYYKNKYDVQIYYEANDSNVQNIYFRPDTWIDEGSYVLIEDKIWLLSSFIYHNGMQPKGKINYCNYHLKWEDGFNSFKYPAAVVNNLSAAQNLDDNQYIALSGDNVLILTQLNEDTNKIKHKDRFTLNSKAWEVQAIDSISGYKNDLGILYLAVKNVPIKDEEKKDEDEILEEEIDLNEDDYFIYIDGLDEVIINREVKYKVKLYYKEEEINKDDYNVIWDVDNENLATINEDGLLEIGNEPGEIKIKVICEHIIDEQANETYEITSEKDVRIGWW